MRSFVLALALLAGCGSVASEAVRLDTFVWTSDLTRFGGFSGLEVTADGMGFTALSDRGTIWRGTFERADGRITAINNINRNKLSRPNGKPLPANDDDTEGLAVGPDGTIYVSFEGVPAHVYAYADMTAPAQVLRGHRDFAMMQPNSGLEALAVGPDSALYTLAERSGRADRPYPVYVLRDGVWATPFSLPRRDAFLPVGLDIGPDGMMYLLERDFTGIGFRSRVRRFDLTGGAEQVLLETRTGEYDNLESISVWQDATGALRLTMISDDNFRFFQQTQLVEFVLTP